MEKIDIALPQPLLLSNYVILSSDIGVNFTVFIHFDFSGSVNSVDNFGDFDIKEIFEEVKEHIIDRFYSSPRAGFDVYLNHVISVEELMNSIDMNLLFMVIITCQRLFRFDELFFLSVIVRMRLFRIILSPK